ncbi:hypothetical protein [Haladaptatus halobius]|uniref:hypothetical protein n=1 Tax=Haladaptatus halobius TaxID=2884875 RepID=UPI001D09F163|nr:hypothetical protein [Haladaptatus halobius]
MRSRTFALLVLVVLVAVTTPILGARPPVDVCTPCSGVGTDIERSTATVVIHENGIADWTIRNRLADDEIRNFSENRYALVAAADGAFDAPTPTTLRDARVTSDDVVVLRYRMTRR